MPAAPKPEDHKAPVEPFIWTAPDGRTVSFLPFSRLPVKAFRSVRDASDMDAMFILIDAATDEDGAAVLDEQPLEVLNEAIEGWQAASGVALGES